MLSKITTTMLKEGLKSAVTITLEVASAAMDKGAELADDAKEYIESLDAKDTTARDARNESRSWTNIFKGE